ncbi:ABC transporter permease [Rhodococcus sp. ACPA4]|jgi:NitT/TauT family transport system permease protein|uniref:NitT/TauT family transport system permease protein n=2 Tax=Nocardiaceae TaxID=85025 RepID=A0A652YPM5_NOCGL|nr:MULTISPECIES: ABC transporter permease [Rhodococcus]NMD62692.1 ABC transporter permease [Nocardia globerula]KJF25252.1 putative aliphatic sulfonates transport permease protein ssuC [Rhodococcus sp. AD45]MDV6270102.1 ABC transporter permease [Rhodococcus globerulus]MDV8065891.1 ABC transporter permease [Rhodococcus sp. IEGM 1366]PBC44011.1 ABC transporter permease [Rhodococcus sp. ACPA4]
MTPPAAVATTRVDPVLQPVPPEEKKPKGKKVVVGATGAKAKLSGGSLLAVQIALLIAILAAWQISYNYAGENKLVVSNPKLVWEAFLAWQEKGTFWPDLWSTVSAAFIALILSAVIGIAAGIGLALAPSVEAVVSPFLDAINAMPRIALAPVFVIYFGIGSTSKIVLAFTLVVFIITINTRAGVSSADSELLRLSVVMGASKWQRFYKVLLPVAVPSIFAGLRLGLIYSLLGVVGAELIASTSGLGQQISASSAAFDLGTVYAALIVLAVIAAVFNAAAGRIEKSILRWQPPQDA